MIRNERHYKITRAQAEKFRAAIARAKTSPPPAKVHPKLHAATIDGLKAQLGDLERELRVYEQLKSGKGAKRLAGTLRELGALLIQARIARGWTQLQLAEKLGLQMQKIQQYEATEYASASLTRLLEVWQALGAAIAIDVDLVELPDLRKLAIEHAGRRR